MWRQNEYLAKNTQICSQAANEYSVYLQQFPNAESWEIMVHLYIDIGGLLARCVGADIPLTDGNVRDFMVGFTQAQPLFAMVDVGRDPQKLSQKVEGMFQLFANNQRQDHGAEVLP